MKYADAGKSERLKKIVKLLKQKPCSTMEIIHKTNCAAVSAAISELRQQGYKITCYTRRNINGRYYIYELT